MRGGVRNLLAATFWAATTAWVSLSTQTAAGMQSLSSGQCAGWGWCVCVGGAWANKGGCMLWTTGWWLNLLLHMHIYSTSNLLLPDACV